MVSFELDREIEKDVFRPVSIASDLWQGFCKRPFLKSQQFAACKVLLEICKTCVHCMKFDVRHEF